MFKNAKYHKKSFVQLKDLQSASLQQVSFSMLTQHPLLVQHLLTMRSLSISLPWVWFGSLGFHCFALSWIFASFGLSIFIFCSYFLAMLASCILTFLGTFFTARANQGSLAVPVEGQVGLGLCCLLGTFKSVSFLPGSCSCVSVLWWSVIFSSALLDPSMSSHTLSFASTVHQLLSL